ncbi:MAG: (2Fe-2S) ferredoxin domain-containing protein [Burkholderiales bacterium]
MSYYQRHMFICTNQRDNGEVCCAQSNPQAMVDHAKARLKAMNLTGAGKFRVQKAGCLDRCSQGPVAEVSPESGSDTFDYQADL